MIKKIFTYIEYKIADEDSSGCSCVFSMGECSPLELFSVILFVHEESMPEKLAPKRNFSESFRTCALICGLFMVTKDTALNSHCTACSV